MRTSQTYKDDISKSWLQYKENPHIQKNKVTNEFRCKTCQKKLGDNAGGVAGHCKSVHDMKIDGTFLSTENEVVEQEDEPVKKETSTEMFERLFLNKEKTDSASSSLPVPYQPRGDLEPYHSYYPKPSPSLEQRVEKNVGYWEKCIEYKKKGTPTKLIRPLLEEIGLNEDDLDEGLELEYRLKDQKLLDFYQWMIEYGFPPEDAYLVYYLRKQDLAKTHLSQMML